MPSRTESLTLFDQHVSLVRGMALKLCRRYRVRPDDRPDIVNAALMGLWQSCERFDGRCKLLSFAAHRIEGACLDRMRELFGGRGEARKRRARVRGAVSIHHNRPEEDARLADCIADPHSLPACEDASERLESLVMWLWPDERRYVGLRLSGLKQHEIGEQLGLSESRVSQIESVVFARMREIGGGGC